jgi:hypothetical protein
MNITNCTIIVSSFDGFSDCWDVCIYGMKKYWPNCPYPKFLLTNKKDSPDEDYIPSIKVGTDKGWASNLKSALNGINTKYIIYLQDDYWIDKKVNQPYIAELISMFEKDKWDYFRLVPIPKADSRISNNNIYGKTTSKVKYQVGLQAAIWRKDFLNNLLINGESGWDFESYSRTRLKSKNVKSFSALSRKTWKYFSYCDGTAIRKAKWTNGAITYIKNEELDFDLSKRKQESNFETKLLYFGTKGLLCKTISYFLLRSHQFTKGERTFISIFKL